MVNCKIALKLLSNNLPFFLFTFQYQCHKIVFMINQLMHWNYIWRIIDTEYLSILMRNKYENKKIYNINMRIIHFHGSLIYSLNIWLYLQVSKYMSWIWMLNWMSLKREIDFENSMNVFARTQISIIFHRNDIAFVQTVGIASTWK